MRLVITEHLPCLRILLTRSEKGSRRLIVVGLVLSFVSLWTMKRENAKRNLNSPPLAIRTEQGLRFVLLDLRLTGHWETYENKQGSVGSNF